jgi:ubiquitin-conjugating enzyme E2 variant
MVDQPKTDAGQRRRPRWLVAAELSSIVLLLTLAANLAGRIAIALEGSSAGWTLLPALLAAMLCADLFSGLVHWGGDKLFREDTPIVGDLVIRPFREHHVHPEAIVGHHFLEVNGNNGGAVLLPLLIAYAGGGPDQTAKSLFAHGFVLFLASMVFLTNQFHKWAHARRVPRAVAWLQRRRLILSPEAHAKHHRGDFARAYCVTTGWLNPALDRLGFFRGMERWLGAPGRTTLPPYAMAASAAGRTSRLDAGDAERREASPACADTRSLSGFPVMRDDRRAFAEPVGV